MPTYEYECLECKHKFSEFQSITADPIESCVKCGKNVRKVFGAAGIIFKGKGFYVNDYKNKNDSSKNGNTSSENNSASSSCSNCETCPSANN